MKKFFTLIAFTSALVPAMHGMEADLFADARKKHGHLITLIKNADVDAFKCAFDEAKLPSSNSLRINAAKMETIKAVLVLEQVAFETKEAIAKELEALGDNNKNWSKIAKGALGTAGGSISGLWLTAFVSSMATDKTPETIKRFANTRFTNWLKNDLGKDLSSFWRGNIIGSVVGIVVPSSFILAHYGITQGYKNLKSGLDYKQHLQDQLANLDAIAAHIAHGTQVTHA